MEKPGKWIFTISLIILTSIFFAQVIGLLGKQSLGYSIKYIETYTILGIAALGFLAVFGVLIEAAAKRISDHPLLDIFSIFDFDESQEFRLFSGDSVNIFFGILAGVSFTIFIVFTAIQFNVVWQPIPSALAVDGIALDPMAAGHDAQLQELGISRTTEAYFSSVPVSFFEDINYNYFLPTIITAALLFIPILLGMELNKGTWTIFMTVGCIISSGIAGAIQSGIIPTFSGAHSDVYTTVASFFAAAVFSFFASWINLQIGFPISIPAHFSNNWIVTMTLFTTLSIGMAVAKMGLFAYAVPRIRNILRKGDYHGN